MPATKIMAIFNTFIMIFHISYSIIGDNEEHVATIADTNRGFERWDMNRISGHSLIAVFVVLLFIPACVIAASDMPVVRSINGPTSREIVTSGSEGTIRLSVIVADGTPPYTYTWLQHPAESFTSVDQDGIVYFQTEGNTLFTGPQYSSASFNLQEDFDTDDRGHGWITVIVTDSKGKRALWVDDNNGRLHDYFVWGIELWEEDYRISDELERAVAATHVYTLPSSFPYTLPVSSTPAKPEETPLSGGLIPVKSCFDEGTRCYGGPDCINGICVDPCQGSSSPFCQCDCIVTPPESEFPWVVIVGSLAVVAVAAGLIAILRGKPKKKGQQPPEQYILQLSKDTVKVSPQKSDSFTVTAWKVTEEGGILPVPSALIRAIPPPNIPDLSLDPASGNGSLTPSVSLRHFPGSVTGVITITASAGGKSVTADVKVTIEGEADIEFD